MCRSMYFQDENYICYKEQGLRTCSAMRVELVFHSKSNYLSVFYSVKNISFLPCRSMNVKEENYKGYKQDGLTTCSAMRVELAFNRKTNYVSGFYSVKNISLVPCRSMYFQEEQYKCYMQESVKTCWAMKVQLAFNSKTNYVSGFYSVQNISFVPCRSVYFQDENYECYKQDGLTTCSGMIVELAFHSKTNYGSRFYSVKKWAFCHAGQCMSRKKTINFTSKTV